MHFVPLSSERHGPLQTSHQRTGQSFFLVPCSGMQKHTHPYTTMQRSFQVNAPSRKKAKGVHEFQDPADGREQCMLNINSLTAERNKILYPYTHTHTTAKIPLLCLLGPISEELLGHSASSLVMSPAAQYRHRAGTAEGRQSWQDGATGTYYI